MSARIRNHVRSNIIGYVCLFWLMTGTAYAAVIVNSNSDVARNTISGHNPPTGDHPNLIAGSVDATDLANGAVTGAKLATGSVTSPKVADNSMTGSGGGAGLKRLLKGNAGFFIDAVENALRKATRLTPDSATPRLHLQLPASF